MSLCFIKLICFVTIIILNAFKGLAYSSEWIPNSNHVRLQSYFGPSGLRGPVMQTTVEHYFILFCLSFSPVVTFLKEGFMLWF